MIWFEKNTFYITGKNRLNHPISKGCDRFLRCTHDACLNVGRRICRSNHEISYLMAVIIISDFIVHSIRNPWFLRSSFCVWFTIRSLLQRQKKNRQAVGACAIHCYRLFNGNIFLFRCQRLFLRNAHTQFTVVVGSANLLFAYSFTNIKASLEITADSLLANYITFAIFFFVLRFPRCHNCQISVA